MSAFDNFPQWAAQGKAILDELDKAQKQTEAAKAQLVELEAQAQALFRGEPVKRKGGRPKGSKNKPKVAEQPLPTITPPPGMNGAYGVTADQG